MLRGQILSGAQSWALESWPLDGDKAHEWQSKMSPVKKETVPQQRQRNLNSSHRSPKLVVSGQARVISGHLQDSRFYQLDLPRRQMILISLVEKQKLEHPNNVLSPAWISHPRIIAMMPVRRQQLR
jgi:hypothetical protein